MSNLIYVLESVYMDIDYEIDVDSLIEWCNKKYMYNNHFFYHNQTFYLLEFCCTNDFIFGILEKDISAYDVNKLYSHLFNSTSPHIINRTNGTNRCHWIAKCFHLKDHHFKLDPVYKEELIVQDIHGNTPLHYAYFYLKQWLIEQLCHEKIWLKNKTGQSIEYLNRIQGQSVEIVSKCIRTFYRERLSRMGVSVVIQHRILKYLAK